MKDIWLISNFLLWQWHVRQIRLDNYLDLSNLKHIVLQFVFGRQDLITDDYNLSQEMNIILLTSVIINSCNAYY